MEDQNWLQYLSLWEEYEKAVDISIAIWSPGGGCCINPSPVKCSQKECTWDKIFELQKTIDHVKRISALGRLITNI